jgi:hypothetical protein
MLSVVPDNNYPNMWRIQTKDGLSDMANLTRAKDAAAMIARADSYSDLSASDGMKSSITQPSSRFA